MDEHKLDSFFREYGATFPKFETLPASQIKNVIADLCRHIAERDDGAVTEVLSRIQSGRDVFAGLNATDNNFSFGDLLLRSGIERPEFLFLNWGRFDDIDRIASVDFDDYFADIWYPAVDDVEIFGESADWLVYVRHDGAIGVIDTHGSSFGVPASVRSSEH